MLLPIWIELTLLIQWKVPCAEFSTLKLEIGWLEKYYRLSKEKVNKLSKEVFPKPQWKEKSEKEESKQPVK